MKWVKDLYWEIYNWIVIALCPRYKIPKIHIEMTSTPIVAKTRKLSDKWNCERVDNMETFIDNQCALNHTSEGVK